MHHQDNVKVEPMSNGICWTVPPELMEVASDIPDLLEELVCTFRSDSSLRMESMQLAVRESDRNVLRSQAHTVRGSARQLGAKVVADLCQQLESSALSAPWPDLRQLVESVAVHLGATHRAMATYMNGIEAEAER